MFAVNTRVQTVKHCLLANDLLFFMMKRIRSANHNALALLVVFMFISSSSLLWIIPALGINKSLLSSTGETLILKQQAVNACIIFLEIYAIRSIHENLCQYFYIQIALFRCFSM